MKATELGSKGNISDRVFESLLRQASESAKSHQLRLLKSPGPKRKPTGGEEKVRRQDLEASGHV